MVATGAMVSTIRGLVASDMAVRTERAVVEPITIGIEVGFGKIGVEGDF